jgi:hypothetical protein
MMCILDRVLAGSRGERMFQRAPMPRGALMKITLPRVSGKKSMLNLGTRKQWGKKNSVREVADRKGPEEGGKREGGKGGGHALLSDLYSDILML